MSDIPIGSPPAPPGRHAAPGGWYPDPVDPGQERYWDGWQWSRNTRPREATATSTPQMPPQAGPYVPSAAPALPPLTAAARKPITTADGVPLASWWWRVLAALIDSLLTGLLVAVLCLRIYRQMAAGIIAYLEEGLRIQQSGGTPPQLDVTSLVSRTDTLIITAVTVAVGMTYHMLFLRLRSATLGKLACGLRVVPVDRGRSTERLGWDLVGIRAAIWVLPNLTSLLALFSLADALFPLWQPKRQALHDIAAKTQVVRIR